MWISRIITHLACFVIGMLVVLLMNGSPPTESFSEMVNATQHRRIVRIFDGHRVAAVKQWQDGCVTVWIKDGRELRGLYAEPPLDSTVAVLLGRSE